MSDILLNEEGYCYFSFHIFWTYTGVCLFFFLDHLCANKAVTSCLALHSNIFILVNGHVVLNDKGSEGGAMEELVFKQALAILMCGSYRNQLLNLFVRPALVSVALQMTQSFRKGTLLY